MKGVRCDLAELDELEQELQEERELAKLYPDRYTQVVALREREWKEKLNERLD